MNWTEKYGIKVINSRSCWENFSSVDELPLPEETKMEYENAQQGSTVRIEPIEIAFALPLEDVLRVPPEILQAIEMWCCATMLHPEKTFNLDVPPIRFFGYLFYTTIEEIEKFKPELFEPHIRGIQNIIMVDRVKWTMNQKHDFDTMKNWQSFYRRIGFGIRPTIQEKAA